MCGITGVLHLDRRPAEPVIVQRMTDAIAHRGPDGEGLFMDGGLGFGHRRLAIIDLSEAGRQPMSTADGRFVLNYNGELYNHRELRPLLQAEGWKFRSQCDAEVVLYALAEWGLEALDRFNGMFALALWDSRERTMLLARDRYGVKPLYVTRCGNTVLFGSEVKAILANPVYGVAMDEKALLEYFTFQNFFTERTLFRGVSLMPPGSWIRYREGDLSSTSPTTYWDFDVVEEERGGADDEYVEELDRLFSQAVNRQLVADVPVNSYLSGGLDSGSITAAASAQMPGMKTFTVGFDMTSASGVELNYDERSAAEHMSYVFGTEHYEMVLKAGDLERIMPRLTWHLEEPRVGQSYPNFYAAGLASKFGKVVLSGTGGDELFGGYPWRYSRALTSTSFDDYIDQYYSFWQRLIQNKLMPSVFAPIWPDVKDVWTRDIFRDVYRSGSDHPVSPQDHVNQSIYLEAKTFLHSLLVVEDKLSMAHGLESRVPFLDNDLVDFAMKLPVRLKVANLNDVVRMNENEPGHKTARYYERSRDGKLLLRQVMERYVPPAVSQREKQGFSAPDASWFRGESIDYVRRRLWSDARIFEFLDADTVRSLVTDHLEGRENRRLLIWSLLSVEQWCETFLSTQQSSRP